MAFSPVFGISQAQITTRMACMDILTNSELRHYIDRVCVNGQNGNLRALADRVIASRTTKDEYSLR